MPALRRPARWHAGVTLAEMLAVVAIIALVASIALPSADTVNDPVAAAAATEVAHAIRFAQREALRTGKYHVAEIDPASQTVRVYRLTSSGTIGEDTGNPVMHPVDKRTYRIQLADHAPTRAILASSDFVYGASRKGDIAFGPDGTPVNAEFVKGKAPTAALSTDGIVRVTAGAATRTVTVDKTTGRVKL